VTPRTSCGSRLTTCASVPSVSYNG
jgi:hypothetical protein